MSARGRWIYENNTVWSKQSPRGYMAHVCYILMKWDSRKVYTCIIRLLFIAFLARGDVDNAYDFRFEITSANA